MQESLKQLGVNSSGIAEKNSHIWKALDEREASLKVHELKNNDEKEKYLREILKDKPHGFLKAKKELANLIKEKDPSYAFELLISACLSSPIDPGVYLMHAKLAICHKAWQVAKDYLETAKWLCLGCDELILKEVESLMIEVKQKILDGESDNSKNDFWRNKYIDKYWILDKLYIQTRYQEAEIFAFKLLDTFPNNTGNFHTVLKALSLLENKNILLKYQRYVNEKLHDELSKNLYLGIFEYFMCDFDRCEQYLTKVLEKESLNSKASFYLSLNYLLKSDTEKFKYISKRIIPESETDYIALYFISSALLNVKMPEEIFPDDKNIAREISKILKLILKHDQKELVLKIVYQFKLLNYFLILPYLQVYLTEIYIEKNMLDEAKDVLKGCDNYEVHRLKSWIFRIEGNHALAEKELLEYRKKYVPDKEEGFFCKLINLDLPKESPNDIEAMFTYVAKAYEETKQIINNLSGEYGLNEMTCVETGCQDCCKKTFPQVTYIEYFYIRKWLDTQPDEFKQTVFDNSKKIVAMYKEKYKKDPPFVIGDVDPRQDYPFEFTFQCAFLGDNKCNIYNVRPFTCRAYGFSSFDGYTFKGCNYFFEQFKKSNKLWNYRKVINAKSFFDYAKICDEKLVGTKVMAPIPVWFAQNHEETLSKLTEAVTRSV